MKTVFAGVLVLVLCGCGGRHVTVLGDHSLSLHGCSPLPNCVSSTTRILYNRTTPFELLVPPPEAWPKIQEAVAQISRTEIVEVDDRYLHAKCTSLVFRFVDHLELVLYPEEKRVSVRSSSAIAIFDFGVNRLRIHRLRTRLVEMGVIR
jgi:uncharacterized protein (DUF1499 family)